MECLLLLLIFLMLVQLLAMAVLFKYVEERVRPDLRALGKGIQQLKDWYLQDKELQARESEKHDATTR